MEVLDARYDGVAAKIFHNITDVVLDIHAVWVVFKLKDAKEDTNAVEDWKTLLAVKKFARNVGKIGEAQLKSAS